MQHIFSLRVVILAVGFCGIVAGQFTPYYESAATAVFAIHYAITAARYPTSISDLPMSKYDDIWPQAEQEALQLKLLGYTPQQICTALAKQFFKDTDKYNTVKGWHARTFPGEWPSADNKGDIKKPIHHPGPQPQPHTCIPQMPSISFHSAYKQDSPQHHYHGFVQQMPPEDFGSLYQLGEPFPGLSQNPIDWDNAEDTGYLGGDLSLSVDDQQLNIQDNEPARQPDPASHHRRSNPLQHANHQGVLQLAADPLTVGSGNDRTYSTPNPQQLDCSFEGQYGTLQPSAKRYRANSTFDNPNPAPQYPLPPAPTMKFGVIHKGHNQISWRPICMNSSGMVKVDPDGFPTDHRRKRVKGQPGSETRDSLALYQLQLNMPNLVPQESPASQAMQSDTTQDPTVNHHVHPSKVSVHSDLRDSGYVSAFDSAVLDSIRSSFSSLNLADDVNFKTDYKEADDGYVDVKVKAKWRMRRSYLEKLRDAPINGPSS